MCAIGIGAIDFSTKSLVRLPFEFVFFAAIFAVLARVGLVAAMSSWLFLSVLKNLQFVWPLTQWYSITGVIGVALSGAVVVAAYRHPGAGASDSSVSWASG